MHILVSNDDGYQAPGLICLVEALERIARVTVIAPDRNRSGASNALTLDRPLFVTRGHDGFYRVAGTPTDCVHLGITGFLQDEPDLVVSGINAGPNLGDDVIYSGTVAAAMEGRSLGLPSIAVSLASNKCTHYETAARVALHLASRLQGCDLPAATILNVNVPDVPESELAGLQATRLGFRHRAEPVIAAKDPRGRPIYWVGEAGREQDAGPGTDFCAVREGRVSVTPIQVDLTRHQSVDALAGWLDAP